MENKRKIGILTLPLHTNYGGILQAWALQTVLEGMGHDVEVLGLKEVGHKPLLMPFVWLKRGVLKCIGGFTGDVFIELSKKRKYKAINTFKRRYLKEYKLDMLTSIPEHRYDAIVAGSDQVWRKEYIRDLWKCNDLSAAFLSGVSDDTVRVAYAASLGIDRWQFDEIESAKIKASLKRFRAISVREYSGVDLLKNNLGIQSTWLADPTMLLTKEDYLTLVKTADRHSSGGVVSYILDKSEEKNLLIDKVRQGYNGIHTELNVDSKERPCTPIECWLGSIASAGIVVTDSFHGCVFSIIFGRPLVFIMNEERGNARFDSLIRMFGIENNFVSSIDDFDADKDYSLPEDIGDKLSSYRKAGIEFLNRALA